MSRVCVKNLPKYATEERLREFFSQKGEVTDAKLMRTKDGKSRQFGFVGFRTEHEAELALNYFNKSFMDTCRITCEIARKVGDPDIPRPWSRHSLKKKEKSSEEENRITGSTISKGKIKKKSKTDDENDDPQLEEFLQVMQHSKSKLWANDTLTAAPSASDKTKSQTEKGHKEASDGEVSDLDGSDGEGNVLLEKDKADKPNVLPHDEVLTDIDYFRSRVKKKWSDSENSDDEGSVDGSDRGNSDENDGNGKKSKQKVKHDHVPVGPRDVSEREALYGTGEGDDSVDPSSSPRNKNDDVLESGRLFIRNLPYSATEEELEEHFSKYGTISQVHIVIDKETRRSKGFAFILFAVPESAARALEKMDSSSFQGRLLHVMPAKQKYQPNAPETFSDSKTLKQKRNAERKASEASGNTRAWNTLFMRPDTIVENIARKFGVSKSELLDRESNDLAVRIALGETQVIAETKKYLSTTGVNISSLEEFATGKTDGLKRSSHVIIVKNLPYSSSEGELSDMFGKYGSLNKIILPPTKTLAVVIFLEPAEARAAFKGLAYKRYKDAPLYLEWAPANILNQTSNVDGNKVVDEDEHDETSTRAFLQRQVEDTTDADVDHDRIESRSLYVKNLNFKTSDESVKSHFAEHMKEGKILSVRVKKHMKNGKNLSMGFGFIEFDSVDTALNVCKNLQGTVLNGHALILQLCHAKKDETLPKKNENDRSSTKLIVRNVAFEATEKDLRQLFNPFGQIKSLRLPMKFGNHRGFAFVEFVTKQEARNALEALSNTHLYGRHLVLERAKEGESLEELRARTAAQFTDSAKLSKKRKQLAILDEGNVKFGRFVE